MGLPVDNLEKCERSMIVIDDSICEKNPSVRSDLKRMMGKKESEQAKGKCLLYRRMIPN